MDRKNFFRFTVFFVAAFLAVWYTSRPYPPPGLEGMGLVQVDSLDVGDDFSEALHGYVIQGQTWAGVNTLRGLVSNESVADGGRSFNGFESFVVSSVPGRELVVLKRYDLYPDNQSVVLFAGVDNLGVVNFSGEEGKSKKYGELSFVIPGEYVRGDRTLVTMKYLGGRSDVSSLHYWFYSEGGSPMGDIKRLASAAFFAAVASLVLVYGPGLFKRLFAGRMFPLLPFLMVLLLSSLYCRYVFYGTPHMVDGITNMFQAKLLLQGRFYLEVPAEFDRYFSHWYVFYKEGRLLGKYPMGQPILMAVGELFSLGDFVNPLFGALSAVLVYYLSRMVYDERTGRYSSLLAASSFFLILHSSEFTNHAPMLFFMLAFQLFFLRSLSREGFLNPLAAGLSLGYGVILRPYTALAVSTAYAAYLLAVRLKERSFMPKKYSALKAAVFISAVSVFVVVFALHNEMLTGSYATPGHFYYDSNDRPGFGSGYHTPGRAVDNAVDYIKALSEYVTGEGRALVLLAVFAFLLYHRANRFDVLFAVTSAIVLLFYSAYHHQDFNYGPRYLLEVMPLVCMLIVRALEVFNDERLLKALVLAALCSNLMSLSDSISQYSTAYSVNGRFNQMFDIIKSSLDRKTVIFVDSGVYPALMQSNNWDFENDRFVYARYVRPDENRNFTSNYFPQYDCKTFTPKDRERILGDCT